MAGSAAPPSFKRPRFPRFVPSRGLGRLAVATVGAIALAALFHAQLLTLIAHGVIAPRWDGPVDHILILDGDTRYDEAAARYRDGRARSIVLVEAPPNELVRLGILPQRESLGTRLLVQGGVPLDDIERFERLWRDLAAHLDAAPDATWLVIATQFRSRELRLIARKTLGEGARRLRWLPNPDANYNANSWWREREGIKDLATAYLALGWEIVRGSQPEPSHPFDADAWLAEYRTARGF